ncbi:MAG TPA: LON peptidase substrate-binding domain-containing protein, partial [Thiolinea sp.]|nr:LON peptidase substrate-binding domain-containing protein [Thiolinea sp.]
MENELNAPQAPAENRPALPDDALILIPVRNVVLFPGIVAPVTLSREPALQAAQDAVNQGHKIGLLLQHDASVDNPDGSQLYRIGTMANILRYVT